MIDGISATARFAELEYGARKLGLIGPSTSLRVEQSSSFGLYLVLIGFFFLGGAGVVFVCNSLRVQGLC